VAIATSIAERSQSYVAKNSGEKPKQLLIEYPLDAEWKLIEPQQPAEKTRDLYRFALEAQPGEPAKLEIREQQPIEERVAVNDLSNETIAFYLFAKEISPEVKAALAELQNRKSGLAHLQQQHERLEARAAAISGEQARIRENMTRLDRNSDLYNRYVKKFSQQEDEVEELAGKAGKLREQIDQQRKALSEYVAGLKLE
jgi:chromosome segregation ATPase